MTQPQSDRASEGHLDQQIKAGRFTAIAWLILSLPWLVLFSFAQDYLRLGILGFSIANQLLALFLFRIGQHYAARAYWLAVQVTTFFVGTYFLGRFGAPDLLFLFLLGLPFLLFSWKSERTTLIVFEAIIFLAATLAFAFDWLHLNTQWFSYPATPYQSPNPDLHSFGLKLTVAILIMLEIAYFVRLSQFATDAAEEALKKSDEAARAKGNFLANMSHEIRTPMNGLVGMIEVLESTKLDNQQNRIIGTMRNSAFALLRIINDILDASKVEAGKLDLERSKTELVPIAEGVALTLQNTADQLDVRIRLLVEPTLPEWIMADPGRLRQVLLNLLSNAVKYSAKQLTGRQGEVQFLAEKTPQGTLRFSITDNGIGMDEEFRTKLFAPFTQAETSSNRIVGGTGLGLVITRNLINLMGGTITVDSVPGRGTKVTVDLPLEPVEGPSRRPDLSGLDVICFDLLDETAREGLRRVMSSAGADVTFVREVEELERLDGNSDEQPIILLPTVSDAQSIALKNAAKAVLPQAKVVRFSSTRSARYGLLDDDCYLIQIFPLVTSELLQAVAVLGGRKEGAPRKTPDNAPGIGSANGERSVQIDDVKDTMILIAEDNEINQIVLSNQLDILGYPHEITSNGRDALQKWQSGLFDLVLTDCQMPLMDGFELTREIRRQEAERGSGHTPIIAITANALADEAEKCLETGMDGYLAKPVELSALRKKLSAVLAK